LQSVAPARKTRRGARGSSSTSHCSFASPAPPRHGSFASPAPVDPATARKTTRRGRGSGGFGPVARSPTLLTPPARSPAPPMTELLAAASSFRTRPTLFLPADYGRCLQGERRCTFASPLSSTRKMPRRLSSLPALPEAFTDAHSSQREKKNICLGS
jgi:hypothetical protein